MDWPSLSLSLALGAWTVGLLVPVGILVARWLAFHRFRAKGLIESLLTLPLVLPPTVLGYYLLLGMGGNAPLGRLYQQATGQSLAFSFTGLVVASVFVNIPFTIQPIQRAFEAIPLDVREASACCGMSRWQALWRVELPLAWPGIVTAAVLSFTHTLGEFGVLLMVGGSIPGETKTIAISIFDRVQAFDNQAAGYMSALLLGLSFATIGLSYALANRSHARR